MPYCLVDGLAVMRSATSNCIVTTAVSTALWESARENSTCGGAGKRVREVVVGLGKWVLGTLGTVRAMTVAGEGRAEAEGAEERPTWETMYGRERGGREAGERPTCETM